MEQKLRNGRLDVIVVSNKERPIDIITRKPIAHEDYWRIRYNGKQYPLYEHKDMVCVFPWGWTWDWPKPRKIKDLEALK